MSDVFSSLQQAIESRNIFDLRFDNYIESGDLTIIGSLDLGYYHDIEIYFREVTYISCPTSLSEVKMRLATEDDIKQSTPGLFEGVDDLIICITESEELHANPIRHFIVAKDVEYQLVKVFHYKRDNLKEGESIASWVE